MSVTTGLIFQDKPDNPSGIQRVRFLGVQGVLDEGGAKSTSLYIVEVLSQANVNRMLSFAYIVFMALENIGDYGCGE